MALSSTLSGDWPSIKEEDERQLDLRMSNAHLALRILKGLIRVDAVIEDCNDVCAQDA